MLRHFLYLDADLATEFLSQVEGGVYDEESIHARSVQGRKRGGKVGAGPVAGELGASKSTEDEAARTVRQTPESRFDRLVSLLTSGDELSLLESDEQVQDVIRGQIIETDVVLSMPNFIRMILLATNLAPVMQLLEAAGVAPEIDESAATGLAGALAFGQIIQTLPMTGRLVDGNFKLIMQLKPECARLPGADLDGEATVLAKVRRMLRPSEHYNVVQFLAVQNALPAEMKVEFDKLFQGDEQGQDMFVDAPAALVTPVAVYR